MNSGFWSKLNRPFTILAPMANVTDWAFRQIVIKCGRPDVFYTEFVSADGINAAGLEKFKGELFFEKNERPIVAQFFSAKPENLYKTAELAKKLGFDGIDINMGCPDKSIEKQGAGACLMKNPKLAKEIIDAVIEGAGGLPVSIKTRLGYNKIETDTWIAGLLATKIAALAIHARTRKEMSKVPAHWDELGKISDMAKGSKILIIGNGDVSSMNDVKEKAEKYNLDGIMVGRGIFANPWFFSGKENHSPEERIELMEQHIKNFEKLWTNPPAGGKHYDVIKRFYKIYVTGWPGAKDLRTELMMTKNSFSALEIIEKYKTRI